jgi:VanZ family protein
LLIVRWIAGVWLAALLGLTTLLVVSAYFPFDWDPPRLVQGDVTRTADGSLRFGEMNAARTRGEPSWLGAVRRSGVIRVHLEIDPRASQHEPQASIMMLASDFWHSDFAIGQNRSALIVWLRRPGSDDNGDPPFVVEGVLTPQRWHSVDVTLRRHGIRIGVDGTVRLTAPVPADSARNWGAGQIVLGNEVHGGRPWEGSIRHAEVVAPGADVDYARPGALWIPRHYLYLPDHVAPFPPPNTKEWLILLLHLLSFIPVGFLIAIARRPPIRPIPATLIATGFAVVLAAGKFLFHARHTAVADIALQAAGALLGALLALLVSHLYVSRFAAAGSGSASRSRRDMAETGSGQEMASSGSSNAIDTSSEGS